MVGETAKPTVQATSGYTRRSLDTRAALTRLAGVVAAVGLIAPIAGCAASGGPSPDSGSCLLGTWDLDFASSADRNSSATTTGEYTMVFETETVTVDVDVSSSMMTTVDGIDATIDQVITGSAKQKYSVNGAELTYGDVVWAKGSGKTTIERDGETTTEENDFAPAAGVTVEMECENDQLVLTSAPESEITAGVATVDQVFTRR